MVINMEATIEPETLEQTEAKLQEQLKKVQLAKKMRSEPQRTAALDDVMQRLKEIQDTLRQQNWGADFDEIKPMLGAIQSTLSGLNNKITSIGKGNNNIFILILVVFELLLIAGLYLK